jgi:hypothetical protein
LREAEQLLLDYAVLPNMDNFLRRYHDGEYHPPGSRRSRGNQAHGGDARDQRDRGQQSTMNDSKTASKQEKEEEEEKDEGQAKGKLR